ncbi:MAG: hypothetical protein M2R45_03405 [Verrucomicrobia subdivision 3 bacterium]|nr:hypothetical protein [Limisphaerales bacterium]MCS1416310.1 hypothetical protein [Limisphaerales bacterium]
MSADRNSKLVLVGAAIFVLVLLVAQVTYIVPPGHRGVQVTLGKVSPNFKPEGIGFKPPFISSIRLLNVRQKTVQRTTTCISKDLQEIKTTVAVLYRIPENSVVEIFQKYKGDPFGTLVYPRVDEALKEVTKERTAQNTVQERNHVKSSSLEIARAKVGSLIHIADLVLEDISLSEKLENAIEQKMVQEQNANKAIFEQAKARIDAQTRIISAKGEADSIRIRGQALAENPAYIDLQIVDTWDGRTPRVISGNQKGASLLLPVDKQTDQRANDR